MIPFNAPPVVGTELDYMQSAMGSGKLCGDGGFTRRCQQWLEQRFGSAKVLLTPSCTASLEMAALLLDIQPGDEVIMPSYTFVSTANAFVLRGAKIVFVDVRPDTMNIDETLIEAAITDKTRVIVPVHYAGVACEMDTIMALAKKHNLFVVEDAAQGVMSTYKGRALGTIGHIGCFSFHETKNYTAGGEGGATLINDKALIERAEIIREKGTNRSQFFRGQVDKYTWRDIGSSYLMSDLQAAYLWAQLEAADRINQQRLALWQNYYDALAPLAKNGRIELPSIPDGCVQNAHMFYIKLRDIDDRSALINFLKEAEIMAVFHYIPLHGCPAGERFGEFHGEDRYTTKESERLLRLFSLVRTYMPQVKEFAMYSRIDDVLRKTPEELELLKKAGLSDLHLGLESGSDPILDVMNKGVTSADMRKGFHMLDLARIGYYVTVILGLGGRTFSRLHAIETAKFLNTIHPKDIWCLKLHLFPGTPLDRESKRGHFDPMTPEEILREEYLLLENLTVKDCLFEDTTVLNTYTLRGRLPEQKEELLRAMEYLSQMADT